MNLGQLIERLEKEERQDRRVPIGFYRTHPYNPYHAEVCIAFDIEMSIHIYRMLKQAKAAVNQDFEDDMGRKCHAMLDSECYLTATYNSLSGIKITDDLLDQLLWTPSAKHSGCTVNPSDQSGYEDDGYILTMRLLQSDLILTDSEMAACARFTQPSIIQRALKK